MTDETKTTDKPKVQEDEQQKVKPRIVVGNSDPLKELNKLYHAVRDEVTVYGTDKDDFIFYTPDAEHLKKIVADKKLREKERTMIYEGGAGNDIYVVAPEMNLSTYVYEDADPKNKKNNYDILIIVYFDNMTSHAEIQRNLKRDKIDIISYESNSLNFLKKSEVKYNHGGVEDIIILNLSEYKGEFNYNILSNVTKDMIRKYYYWDSKKKYYQSGTADELIKKTKERISKDKKSAALMPPKEAHAHMSVKKKSILAQNTLASSACFTLV